MELDRQDQNPVKSSPSSCVDGDDLTSSTARQTSEVGSSGSVRSKLMADIQSQLKGYGKDPITSMVRLLTHPDDLLARERASMAMEKPTGRKFMNLIHFLWNEKCIKKSETMFSQAKSDFITLKQKKDSWFHELVEGFHLKIRRIETSSKAGSVVFDVGAQHVLSLT
jgi:hypothetical protein